MQRFSVPVTFDCRIEETGAQLSRCSRPLPATRRVASAVQYACGQRRLNAGPLGGLCLGAVLAETSND
jgi:hypothetical protein